MKSFSLRYGGTKLYFGIRSIEKMAKYIEHYENIAIVTGKRSAKLSGSLNDLLDILNNYSLSYKIYDIVTSKLSLLLEGEALSILLRLVP